MIIESSYVTGMPDEDKRIRVRIAKAQDIGDIYNLSKSTFAETWSKEAFSYDISENDNATVIVAEYDGEFAGFADIWSVFDEADLNSIAVLNVFRRKGIADSLIAAMIRLLSASGIVKISLEVRVSNTPAISLYTKYGFKECGIRRGYYLDNGEDALIMQREICDYARK